MAAMMACCAAADLAAAALLPRVLAAAAEHKRQPYDNRTARHAALAFLAVAAAAFLAGTASPAASLQHVALLGAAAAAMSPGGAPLSALLLAAACADWLPGVVLLAVPLALLAASPCHGAQAQRTAGQSSGPPLGPALKALVAYGALVAASVAVLAQACSLLPPGLAATLDRVQLLPAGLQQAVPQPGGPSEAPFAWVGARAAQQSPFQPPSPLLPAAGLQPGLGLHWYLLAQAFPRFRAFFLFVLQAMPAATMLPLALRFPHRPRLLLAAGALLRCLLHPRPQPGMAAMWLGLLPLAGGTLRSVSGLPWFGLGLAAAVLLGESTKELWLGGGGNANFLYGMSLLWSGLQAVLLLRVLRAAAREEAPKAEGAQEPPADSGAKDAATSADLAEGSSE